MGPMKKKTPKEDCQKGIREGFLGEKCNAESERNKMWEGEEAEPGLKKRGVALEDQQDVCRRKRLKKGKVLPLAANSSKADRGRG